MGKLIKWLMQLSASHMRNNLLWEIRSMADYHRLQAETTALKERYEPVSDADDRFNHFRDERYTSEQHSVAAKTLFQLLDRLEYQESGNDMLNDNPELK